MFSAVEQRSHVRSLPPRHIHHQHTCQSHSAEAEQSEAHRQGARLPSRAVEKVGPVFASHYDFPPPAEQQSACQPMGYSSK